MDHVDKWVTSFFLPTAQRGAICMIDSFVKMGKSVTLNYVVPARICEKAPERAKQTIVWKMDFTACGRDNANRFLHRFYAEITVFFPIPLEYKENDSIHILAASKLIVML